MTPVSAEVEETAARGSHGGSAPHSFTVPAVRRGGHAAALPDVLGPLS